MKKLLTIVALVVLNTGCVAAWGDSHKITQEGDLIKVESDQAALNPMRLDHELKDICGGKYVWIKEGGSAFWTTNYYKCEG